MSFAIALAVPEPARALPLQPPRWARAQMEAAAGAPGRMRIVYGTQDPALAAALRARAYAIATRMFGADSAQVLADREAPDEVLAGGAVLLLGGPAANACTRRLAPGLPLEFTPAGFRWRGAAYERPGDLIALAYPNPLAPRRFLFLVAPNSAAALGAHGGWFMGEDDWRIVRAGERVRWGTFAQSAAAPWRYDPALEHDREAERARWNRALAGSGGGALLVRAPAGLPLAAPALAAGRPLLASLDAMGLGAPRARPVSLTLYRSLEEKGMLTRETRAEHVDEGGGAHAALPAGREALDLWSVAAARLVALGADPGSRFLAPSSAWLARRLEGEPLERAVARLYFGRALPTAAEAAMRSGEWRSAIVWTPARALLARAVWETAAPANRRAALLALLRRDPPGTLDSLCAAASLAPVRVAARYRQLADSLAYAGRASLVARRRAPWRPADGFMRGACLAHEVRLEQGYLSAACARTLRSLREAGADWVSLTPFGYVPGDGVPELWPSAEGGAEEESDEAVCEAAARAHALGLRVWLVPHLWSRAWPGDLAFTPPGWARFEARYRAFALHYALLADRERVEGFSIGHEMASSTGRNPQFWRELAASSRAVYAGTLTYSANWDEAQKVGFWDALDLVAVSFYSPLAAKPTRDPAVLAAGAERAFGSLEALARRTQRAVLLAEAGYSAQGAAAVQPWEEGRGPADVETQRACYRALVDASARRDWLAGVLWWKWSSADTPGNPQEASFTPRGRPAEAVVREALRAWQGRPVRVSAAR